MTTRIDKLNELEQKLRRALGPEIRKLKEEISALSKEMGFGNAILGLAEAHSGETPVQTLKVLGDGEHCLIWVFRNYQMVVHIVDSPALMGDGSRIVKWWKRRLAPSQLRTLITSTELFLKKRADKRRQLHQAA